MKILIAHFTTHWVSTVGGLEKVICEFANNLLARGYEVVILYTDKVEGSPYFLLDKRIKTFNILYEEGRQVISEKLPLGLRIYREFCRFKGLKSVQAINAKYKGKMYGNQIKKYIEQCNPDIIVACSGQSIKYVIQDAKCTTIPVIGMIHSDCHKSIPSLSDAELEAMGKCKVIQVLLPSYVIPCQKYVKGTDIVVIGNVVNAATCYAKTGETKANYTIACVGSLNSNKNQKLLADAFSLIAKQYPNWNVEFWGDYHSRAGSIVKKYIEEKHLKQLKIQGTTNAIEDVYANADIFCMPSYTEGFPLALTEAMAAGLPAVGLKICNAVNQLIEDGETGYLVDCTPESLAEGLKKLIENPNLRKAMGKNAQHSMDKYSPEVIWEQWDRLLNKYSNIQS